MERRINGHTRLYALIGSPVGHSGSPAMYNYSFEKLGIDAAYLAFDIPLEKTKDAIDAFRTLNVGGFNITMPNKTAAAQLVDRLSPAAELVGACNTVVVEEDKTMTGHITDGIGFVRNLKEQGVGIEGKKIVSVLSGGNMDVITMASVVQHGLIQRDRIFTISVLLPDRPGELVRVASVIAEEQGNVIKLEHNQFVSTNRNAAVELTITLEAFGTDHKMRIIKALKEHGYNPVQKVASL